jgi:hypothetical protein
MTAGVQDQGRRREVAVRVDGLDCVGAADAAGAGEQQRDADDDEPGEGKLPPGASEKGTVNQGSTPEGSKTDRKDTHDMGVLKLMSVILYDN